MSGRGGWRDGAGRTPVIPRAIMVNIGAEYERIWKQVGELQALEAWERGRKAKAIEAKRRLAGSARTELQPYQRDQRLKKIGGSIDRMGRYNEVRVKRPYGQSDYVATLVLAWCLRTYGEGVASKLTPRRLIECRAAYSRFIGESNRA